MEGEKWNIPTLEYRISVTWRQAKSQNFPTVTELFRVITLRKSYFCAYRYVTINRDAMFESSQWVTSAWFHAQGVKWALLNAAGDPHMQPGVRWAPIIRHNKTVHRYFYNVLQLVTFITIMTIRKSDFVPPVTLIRPLRLFGTREYLM